ncbi:hypothetical protein [Piscirickettsia salmonis]
MPRCIVCLYCKMILESIQTFHKSAVVVSDVEARSIAGFASERA